MIVTRTPLRISFIGGGSDYEGFFNYETGCVVGTTINQYVYVSIMPLPEFSAEKFRFTYRITESVQKASDFKHPVVRSLLSQLDDTQRLNIATMANLPGRSGLGSSSSFTVGLINGLGHLLKKSLTPLELANSAVRVEREILQEPGGLQDQFHAAFGGLRSYRFLSTGDVEASRRQGNDEFYEELSSRLVLLPMQEERDSSFFAQKTIAALQHEEEFNLVRELAQMALEISNSLGNESISIDTKISELIDAVNLGWKLKQEISGEYEGKNKVEELIQISLLAGAAAARLCGAGGSGFILLISQEGGRKKLLESLSKLKAFPISIEQEGSKVLLAGENGYSKLGVVE
jgi:D-glycero-alpha-D-manno-heptose-7-phosphate kinase